jgi:opacity protein-like surface antigen
MKRKTLVIIILFFFSFLANAQRHEIGIQLGTSNLTGDIGKTKYINPLPDGNSFTKDKLPFYGAIMYRMNFNPYQSVRFRLAYNRISFDDRYAQELYRARRGLYGTNSVYEASAIFDYNFLPVNEEQKSMLSPYIFGGISGLMFNTTLEGNKFGFAIPFGAGLKYKFNYNWALFGEFMFRATNSDTLDYSDEYNLGNLNSKDWMNSMSLGLSYSFGRPPCYCQ